LLHAGTIRKSHFNPQRMHELLPFHLFLNKFMDLSQEEFDEYIRPYIVLRRFNAREVVSAAGLVENYFNFLLSGLARTYYKKGSDEIVIQIAAEGHIIHAQQSFHSRKPSDYTVETIEPSCFASITYNGLEMIYAANSKMQHLGRLIITFTMLLKEQMQVQAATLSARERFLQFVEKHPGLMQRVPQKYLASYLNIKPETFSRFKHLIKVART
jgi:CRP-like cAMP-binding protein